MTEAVTGTPPEVKVKVTLKERETEAYVLLEPPLRVDIEVVRRALAERGVVFGVDENALFLVSQQPGEDPVKVAQGMLPQPGRDAKISYFFRVPGKGGAGKPLEMEDGRVDHRELGVIENVNKGQVLATKLEATMGLPGMSVLGHEIPAKNGKDVQLRAGKNVLLSEDELSVTSEIDGQPKVDGSRISVEPIIHVSGDVDFSTGNINFQGSVKVNGSVLPGFTIKATQDIEVGGVLEGAILEAGGKVTVKGGVRQHTVITAHGDVTARFVDSESSITTRANLTILESAMHATLTAGLALKVGKKLIGGVAQAGEYIAAEVIGSVGGTPTVVDVRTGRQAKVIEQIEKAIATLESQLATVNQAFNAIVSNPNAPAGAFEKTREIKVQLEERLEEMQLELEERRGGEDPEAAPKFPFVVAKGGFNPGTQIYFDHLCHHVDTFLHAQRVAEIDEQLTFS